ncbi:hypothetical protein CHLRE_06g256500v5 [Chlamydomonas reinhardtii]|nr:uncharacterized protein CHLRE_06g256500v5 [Chlamydomonas reinhardtii]PNW81693.1 hypothetical protein CHLRE_06g256500v5 [Chlamydomonas reinhardtii]
MWDEAAKAKLRGAANRAGMVTSADPESLVLALEPEAAAVTVAASAPQRQQLSTVTARGPQKKRPQELEAGDVVMVVDCGGGTADVTLHEVVVDTEGRAGGGGRAAAAAAEGVHLLEAAVGKGVLAGGRYVDAALWRLLRGRVGPDVWDEWQRQQPREWTDLASSWETTKRAMKGLTVQLQLPPGLVRMWQQHQPIDGSGSSASPPERQTARRAAGGSPSVSLGVKLCSATGVVELSEAVLEEHVFGPAMAQIVTAAEEVKASGLGQGKKVTKASAVLLAGGFGNSRLLQRRLLRLAGEWGVPLLLPRDPGAAVVTGAALLGAEPGLVRARRCRFTYGIGATTPWSDEHEMHAAIFGYPQKIMNLEDQAYYADAVFATYVRSGQLVATDSTVTERYCPMRSTQQRVKIPLYATPAPAVRYVADTGVRHVAEVIMELPKGWRKTVERRLDYQFEVDMRFGASEITVVARDPRSHNAVAVRVDWR